MAFASLVYDHSTPLEKAQADHEMLGEDTPVTIGTTIEWADRGAVQLHQMFHATREGEKL